jgi:iron complex transport system substrate-binding protein
MQPDLIVGFEQQQPLFGYFTKSLKVMFNGDWTEQSPLGKAEWIKFWCFIRTRFQGDSVFSEIEKNTTLLWF